MQAGEWGMARPTSCVTHTRAKNGPLSGAFDFWGRSQMGSLHPEPAQQFWPVMPTTPILIVAKTAKARSRMGYAMLTG